MSARIGLDLNLLVALFGDPEAWCGISASGAGAAIECPARLALPQARTKSDAADRGVELHKFARVMTVNPAGRSQALLDIPEKWRPTAEGMNIGAALDGFSRIVGCERAYALDAKKRSVRFIGENIDRGYNEELTRRGQPLLSRYEVPFTMDVEAFYDDIPVELDYKSGQNIGDPAEHWQRRICATGLMLFHDTATAISRVAYIWDDGRIVPDGCEFSILDAEDFCDALVKCIDAVWEARLLLANGIMPTVYPSDAACTFCSAIASCPYYTNFAKAMVGRLQEIEKGPELSALTAVEKGNLFDELKKAEKIIEVVLDGLKKMAIQEAFPVGDKHEVRPQDRSRGFFDGAKARGLIITLLGKQEATQEEIDAELKKLDGRTYYTEVRKVKRQLPMAG